jgi:hypothetical protein
VEISAHGGRGGGGQVAWGAAAAGAVGTMPRHVVGMMPRRARSEGDCPGGLGRLVASWAGLTRG